MRGALLALSLAAGAGGCSELAENGGEGAGCVRSSQCQDGLACVPVAPDAGRRQCSADLGGLMGEVPELDAGVAEAGPAPDGAATDAGPVGMDSGPMGTDSGPGGMDAGPTGTDSGPAPSDAAAD